MLRVCSRSIMIVRGVEPSVICVYAKLLKIPSFKTDGRAELKCHRGMKTGHARFCELPHMRATLDASVDANCPAAHVTGTHEDGPGRILKVPLLHREQVVPSLPVNPGLHVQFVKTLLASKEFDPDGQFMHTSEAAAITVEYFPDKHARHMSDAAAAVVRNLPATQLTHTSEAAAIVVEYFPGTQSMHTLDAAANTVEYLPATQLTQMSEAAPAKVENLPAVQLMQTSEAAPITVEYFPAMQSVQTLVETAPITEENFPATHSLHESGPG